MKKYGQIPLTDCIAKLIQDSQTGVRLLPNGKKLASGTIDTYKALLQMVQRYEEFKNKKIQLTYKANAGLAFHTKQIKYWTKFYKDFQKYLFNGPVGIHDNYFSLLMKTLKLTFKYCRKGYQLPIGEYEYIFYSRRIDPAITCLPPDKLAGIIENRLNCNLENSELMTLNAFLFGCATGLRFSDLKKCKKSQLYSHNKSWYLHFMVKKTGKVMKIKIPVWAEAFLDSTRQEGEIFDLPTLSHFNKQLKAIARKLGWEWQVQKYIARKGEIRYLRNVRFCDVISSHAMRRTTISTLLWLQVPETVVREVSGHTPTSKDFYRYVQFTREMLDETTDKAWQKLTSNA